MIRKSTKYPRVTVTTFLSSNPSDHGYFENLLLKLELWSVIGENTLVTFHWKLYTVKKFLSLDSTVFFFL